MALDLVGIRSGGPSRTAIHLPAEALLTSPWSVFLAREFILFFNSEQPKYFPKLLIKLFAVLAYDFYLMPSVIKIDIDILLCNSNVKTAV